MTYTLPARFAGLEEFVPYWGGATSDIRWDRRSSADMSEISRFYDAMIPLKEAALAHLDTFPIDEMPEPEKNLLLLLLSLVQASIAVEMHRHPRVKFSPWPHGIEIVAGPRPHG